MAVLGDPSYPRMSAKSLSILRERFQAALPPTVTTAYLVSVLGGDERSIGSNVGRPLKAMGLVGDDDKPTDRARRWRDDEDYAKVCQEIREEIYPGELLAAFPPPEPDRAGATRWFSRTTGQGDSASRGMAALYALLCQGDPTSINGQSPRASRRPEPRPQQRSASRSPKVAAVPATPVVDADSATSSPARTPDERSTPSLHIDVQIHISPDASPEQIEQIFKSMAIHLYRNGS